MFGRVVKFVMSRNRRERIMLAGVVAAIALVWLTTISKRNRAINDEMRILTGRRDIAKTVLAKEPDIRAELEKIQKIFDTSKTIDALALQLAVENCSRKAGIVYSISASTTKDAGNFRINSLNLSVQRGELATFAIFEREIARLEPYVSISRATLDGDGKGGVSGRYTISSFELISK